MQDTDTELFQSAIMAEESKVRSVKDFMIEYTVQGLREKHDASVIKTGFDDPVQTEKEERDATCSEKREM